MCEHGVYIIKCAFGTSIYLKFCTLRVLNVDSLPNLIILYDIFIYMYVICLKDDIGVFVGLLHCVTICSTKLHQLWQVVHSLYFSFEIKTYIFHSFK